MNIKVSTQPRKEIKYNPSLVGFGQIVFDDKYVLDKVYILQRKNGDYAIELPSISVKKKDENGNYVEKKDGNYAKEDLEVFHPITAMARQELTAAVVHAFRDSCGEKNVPFTITGEFKPDASHSRITPYEQDNQLAFGSVCFGDFVLERVQLLKKNDGTGNKYSAPSRPAKIKDKETGEIKEVYRDWFFPIDAQARLDLMNAIEKAYNNALIEKADTASAKVSNTMSTSQEQGLSLSSFEDVIEAPTQNNRNKR